MAFTITVKDRDELEMSGGKVCDACSCCPCGCVCPCVACNVGVAAREIEFTLESGIATPLSPLED